MKKYLLLLSCSLFAAAQAHALTAKDQLDAMKNLFLEEFSKIDTNQDGVLDKDEYLSFQFENFRANVIEADGFDKPAQKEPAVLKTATPEKKATEEDAPLAGISPALKDMADFDLDFDLDTPATAENQEEGASAALQTKDFLLEEETPKETASESNADLPELDLSLSEDESLDNILEDMQKKENPAPAPEPEKDTAAETQRITAMLENIKKTLPKKIDDITTWTDITYDNNTIAYIYQADVDTSSFSKQEMAALKSSIENEACVNAYYEMCPKIKPVFIDAGTNVTIRYQDKTGLEINSCAFNDETCR